MVERCSTAQAAPAQIACEEPVGERRRARLDPRVSIVVIVVLNVLVFFAASPVIETAAVLMGCAVAAACRRPLAALCWAGAYAALLVGAHALYSLFGMALASVTVTMLMFARVLPIAQFAANMMATTRAGEFACALQQFRVPRRLVVALCVALRFLPAVGGEFHAVSDALKVRGMAMTPAALARRPLHSLERVMVPVIARLGTIADELANAAVTRGIDAAVRRTSYYDLRLGPCDVVVSLAYAALLAAAFALKAGLVS